MQPPSPKADPSILEEFLGSCLYNLVYCWNEIQEYFMNCDYSNDL